MLYLPNDLEAIEVRLYYDSGTRGNPGIAGAGSIIIEQQTRTAPWTIAWRRYTFIGAHSTNNVAEHHTLATGLQECAKRYQDRHVNITIIGDSQLVRHQMLDKATVRVQQVQGPVARSRAALDHLHHYTFVHTRRAGNTMADRLANEAMDRCANGHSGGQSTTSNHDNLHTALPQALLTDIQHHHTPALDIHTTIKTLTKVRATIPQTIRKRKHLKTTATVAQPDVARIP